MFLFYKRWLSFVATIGGLLLIVYKLEAYKHPEYELPLIWFTLSIASSIPIALFTFEGE